MSKNENVKSKEKTEKTNFSESEIQNLMQKQQKKEEEYINLFCFKIKIGLIFTYIYIITGALLNIINRIIFYNYKFRFNFTFTFLQQLINLIIFHFIGKRNKTFINHAGIISFANFYKFKYHYFMFTLIFSINILINFYGNQLVTNISMFLSLRKFNAVMLFIVDFFFYKKKISFITIICIILITGGSLLINSDLFSKDYFGYIVVLINNIATISNSKYSENFRKKTGDSNLKLLIYNSYIINPLLFLSIFLTGEYKKLFIYFTNKNVSQESFIKLFLYIFLSCLFSAILNSSFFISNEKTSSLMTTLLANSKSILTSVTLYLFDKKINKMTFKILFGLIMSTFGALFINIHSFWINTLYK